MDWTRKVNPVNFIADATVRGGTLKLLTILDEYTRECHVLWAERAMKAADVLHWLQKAVAQHGAPEYLRSDNGSEFIAKIVQRWLKENRIKTIYIEPGSPWQNGFVESFHGRFRDECLNREQLWNLTETRVVVGDYRQEYNQVRPHSRLGYESPVCFAARSCCKRRLKSAAGGARKVPHLPSKGNWIFRSPSSC